MATISHPVSFALVKGLRGRTDFYFQRGKQIARTWPRKSNLVGTPAQKVQRRNFAAIECTLKSQNAQQRRAWQAWPPGDGQGWVDFVHRVWMPLAADGSLCNVPDFTRVRVIPRFPWPNSTLRVDWQPVPGTEFPALDVIRTSATPTRPLWPWHVLDFKIQRGGFRQPRWAPSNTGYVRSAPNYVNQEAGFAWYFIPSDWLCCSFSFVPSASPLDTGLVCACQFASP